MTSLDPKPLFKELRDTAREATQVSGPDREAILSRRREMRRKIAALELDEATTAAFSEFLAHTDSRIQRLEHRDTHPHQDSLEILELRADLAWLSLLLGPNRLQGTIRHLAAELDALAPTCREIAELDDGRAELAARDALELLDDIEDRRLGEAAGDLTGEDEPELRRLWYAFLEARDLQMRTGRATETLEKLKEQLIQRIEALSAEYAAEPLSLWSREYDDMILDLLAAQARVPPGQAADVLEGARREMTWLRSLIRDKQRSLKGRKNLRDTAQSLRDSTRRLNKANRKLVRDAQELRLQARQEELFGTRAVRLFENLILWLILLVLVILTVQVMLPSPWPPEDATAQQIAEAEAWAPVHDTLSWIDSAICFIFLIEFFGKLIMVKGRASWFWRHFLIDLIPSIPYGLVANQIFHTMHGSPLDALRAGRVIRGARMFRMFRYIRVARPIIRFVRFFGFLQRGLDRLIRLHGALINRNIVLFEPVRIGVGDGEEAELRKRLRQLLVQMRRAWRLEAARLEVTVRSERIRRFVANLPGEPEIMALPNGQVDDAGGSGRYLRAEELIQNLTRLDADTVEAELGIAGARRISSTLERLDAPLLRDLPILRQLIPAARVGEAVEKVAAAGKALGRYLQKRLAGVHWISDLSGVITGPQFLDRVGAGMVQATERPAKRLLLFGFGFLFFQALVHLLFPGYAGHAEGVDVPFPVSIADWLERTVGTPFLVLGAVCLVLLLFGRWFRRLAGEATDFYNRTAEAQYLNLLKEAKLTNQEEDLETLWDRVIRPEALVSEHGEDRFLEEWKDRTTTRRSARNRMDRVLQLYDDYLDGALFHITDTKTSSQLLGNIALENIRTHCLAFSKQDRKRLAELDLDRTRSAWRGPYLWFRSVTHSITQWTAKLIIDYNRNAIPLAERDSYPPEALAAHDHWLERKLRGEQKEREEVEGIPFFLTTWFSALNFLTADEDRDRAIAEEFGEPTLQAMQLDRQTMIRTVFGTYPFHRRARAERTINPFQLYYRYLAGGKVLFLPFYFLGMALKAVGWLFYRIRVTVNEILHPEEVGDDGKENWASYDVAVRKINRMRKPLFMECSRFRALFDAEYLGLDLIPGEDSGLEGRTYREDLERIGAWDVEWDSFQEIRRERDLALAELEVIAERAGGPECLIWDLGAPEDRCWKEAWRALSIAMSVDYRGCRTLNGLREESLPIVREVIEKEGCVSETTWWRRLTWLLLPTKTLQEACRAFEARYMTGSLSPKERRWFFRAVRADYRGLKRLVQLGTTLPHDTDPDRAAREILSSVVAHPEKWSEPLVTLRAVQSLSVLDVRNYRRQVWALGGYGNE